MPRVNPEQINEVDPKSKNLRERECCLRLQVVRHNVALHRWIPSFHPTDLSHSHFLYMDGQKISHTRYHSIPFLSLPFPSLPFPSTHLSRRWFSLTAQR